MQLLFVWWPMTARVPMCTCTHGTAWWVGGPVPAPPAALCDLCHVWFGLVLDSRHRLAAHSLALL